MSNTVRPLVTDQERRADRESEYVRRGALALGVVTHPLVALIAAVVGVGLARQNKIKPRVYLPIAVVLFVAALLMGRLTPYYQPILEVARAVMQSPGRMRETIVEQVSEHGAEWLVGVMPFAIAAGLFVGALWATWRTRRRATWREEEPDAVEAPPTKVRRALDRLEQWPAAAPTVAEVRTGSGSPMAGTEKWMRDVRRERVRLGVSMSVGTAPMDLAVSELGYHGLIDGPTGFGKTTLLQEIATGVVEAPAMAQHRNPLVIINMKPDPELARTLAGMAQTAGREFHYVTHDGSGGGGRYNPLVSGTPYQIASGIMEAEAHSADGGFSEAHYRRAGERFARFAARALDQLNQLDPDQWPREYGALARLLSVSTLASNSDRFDAALAGDWGRFVKEMEANRDIASWISGIGMRVAAAAEGGARDVLLDRPDSLNLAAAIRSGDVILFDLDAAEDAGAARLVGNLAIQDLTFSLARLGAVQWQWHLDPAGKPVRDANNEKIQDRHCQVIIDEFGALGGSLVFNLFQRARGYGAGLILAEQDTGSLDAAGDWFRSTVINNSNVITTFAQSTDAEFFASLVGTRKDLEETHQIFEDGTWLTDNVYRSGQGNLREVETYVVHPNQLRNLGPGQAVIRVRTRVGEKPSKVAVRRTAEGRHFGTEWPPAGADDELTTAQRQTLAVAPAREAARLRTEMVAQNLETETTRPTPAPDTADEPPVNPWVRAAKDTSEDAPDSAGDDPKGQAQQPVRRQTAPRPPTRMVALRDRDRPTAAP